VKLHRCKTQRETNQKSKTIKTKWQTQAKFNQVLGIEGSKTIQIFTTSMKIEEMEGANLAKGDSTAAI
jgi:hypothetical protein